ncbi:Chromosome partition protein Smc [Roseibaca ekhonensis]|uniref:Chromosome partition protein Smc n=1 Tax=Roseinatronobacter ekhonensis TaxID=254356 RepID=A0A3B0MGV8_9RHOB|nr:AAA family ATPase [Roseibaca ekhonensis]SUZ30377.1 Chromosome partition protein Smc [Roseibaca ekhonensis]
MQFTRLRLNGFKSFVDPTDLIIHPGLTGVVGPNGCGKSNLLEALRWVMGENRASAVRGAGMEDVIFAGTDSRGARHFAEVTLQLDNSARLAPAAFNHADTLEVVRRITRDAGSAYRINGKEVRARDVQMLFADASTGAHSPALVRQGQISELISAKPKARRRILEEAAGISGLYQRRHEAELRLRATETNLERIGDVVEQLAGQLAGLARQAKQAERYRKIGAELRHIEGLLLYARWREADHARTEADATLRAALTTLAQAETAARQAALARTEADGKLDPLREESAVAGAVLQRLAVERQTLDADTERADARLRSLRARIAQLDQDITREEALNTDAHDTLAQLEAEASALEEAASGEEARQHAADADMEACAARLAEAEAAHSAATQQVAGLVAEAQSVARALEEAERQAARAQDQAATAQTAQDEAVTELERAVAALAHAEDEATAGEDLATRADAALGQTEAARAAAQTTESEARAALSEAEGTARSLRSEEAALAKLVARDTDGTAQLIDRLRVAPGYEQALGAALADDLRAPVADGGSGWAALPAYPAPAPLPALADPLAPHVTGSDVLLRRLSQVGIVSPEQGATLQAALAPGQRLVTRAGDLWRWDGLHVAERDATSTTALRLEQRNRLDALRPELAVAEQSAQELRDDHAARKARLDALVAAERQAREARKSAEARQAEAMRARSKAAAARDMAQSRRDSAHAQSERARLELAEVSDRLDGLREAHAALPDLTDARAGVDALAARMAEARRASLAAQSEADRLRRDSASRARRAQEVATSLSGWRARLETASDRVADLSARRADAERRLADARQAPAELAEKRAALHHEMSRAEARAAAAEDALKAGEGAARAAADTERAAERAAADAREGRATAEARHEAAQEAAARAATRIAEELESTPQALLDDLAIDPDDLPDPRGLEDSLTRLRRARDALGAVNLRAEEDAREVQQEHDKLVQESADLEAAIAKLRAGIAALNREGRERLLDAFDKVNANFSNLFQHLFTGGEARLVLVESDDPLDAGLEIMCQPPGKKLSTLSLLSGGEQTLTALALIFAVFLANPAPICVLDEVDAPLDDANVARFCDLLDEMTRRADTRYLVITHNAISMARMDRLFGVTMGERGVSQLVSVDLTQAEDMVA